MKCFNAGKTRMIGLPYGEKNCDNRLSRFHLILVRYGQTDGQTDLLSVSRVSVLTRDKNPASDRKLTFIYTTASLFQRSKSISKCERVGNYVMRVKSCEL